MNGSMKVLVVDDHPVMAKATKGILEQISGIEVVGTVGSGEACLDFVETHRPEIVFLDYHLPDQFGSSVAKEIKNRYPDTHVVIFTGIDVADMYNHLLDIGVSGIISKESSESVVQHMVRCVMDNCTVLPLSLYHNMRLMTGLPAQEFVLTEDEVQIMSMLVKGATHEQIANEIYVSKRSVDNYLKKIYGKLGVKSKVQALEQFVQSNYYLESNRGE
ncbi:response regulator transcription factor [Paenibacillus sp. UNC451MF]|uniref:response regulator transcription factor n=1 Tax=Paenibacillus sp. UNC451MF TaxID=1449063 RepID=UPI00048EDEA5|nr:response regulator transcription factor [Paenibacillus sp. UNC451MF]